MATSSTHKIGLIDNPGCDPPTFFPAPTTCRIQPHAYARQVYSTSLDQNAGHFATIATDKLTSSAMSTAKQLVFVSLALFCLEGIHVCSGNSTAVYVPCKGGLNRLLQLEEMIHISDVVVNGVVSTGTIRQDEFGTFSASVSYYFAYKNDRLLARRGLASVNVVNFQERPGGESSFFFLVRQPNTELSLYCMSPLSQLDKSHEAQYSSLYEVVEKVKEIAAGEAYNHVAIIIVL